MIKDPFFILIILIAIESAILYLANHPAWKRFFSIIPHISWIFFIPMLISTFGWIDPKSPLYKYVTDWILPSSLVILLMTVDLKSIFRLGPMALSIFVIGSVSVGLGMVIAFKLFLPLTGAQYWSGYGALCGSWTGGSANMIAVKEALGTPDPIFLPFAIVDAILPYLWMALLMSGSAWHLKFDAWNKVNPATLDELKKRVASNQHHNQRQFSITSLLAIIGLGLTITFCAQYLSKLLPAVKDVISPFTWVIILSSAAGLILSYTPAKQLENNNSNVIGYFLLYLVLTTIGAKANLSQFSESIVLMGAGAVVIGIHAVCLLLMCRLFKIPSCLAAIASQANLGGVASAPIVAEVYTKGLAPVGLLLAIFGNIIGTYIGITVGQICRMVGN